MSSTGTGCESCSLSSYQPAVYLGQPLVPGGSSQAGLHCAHRTSTVSPCAFCEQEGRLAALSSPLSSFISPPREGGLFGLPCAQLSHPPTHWQIFFTRPPSDCFAIDFPGRAISPSEGLPILYALFKGVAKAALYCAQHSHPPKPRARRDALLSQATTVSSWGLCEQEGHLVAPSHSSEPARCASTGDQQATLVPLP